MSVFFLDGALRAGGEEDWGGVVDKVGVVGGRHFLQVRVAVEEKVWVSHSVRPSFTFV